MLCGGLGSWTFRCYGRNSNHRLFEKSGRGLASVRSAASTRAVKRSNPVRVGDRTHNYVHSYREIGRRVRLDRWADWLCCKSQAALLHLETGIGWVKIRWTKTGYLRP